jgi:hypothetical protein
MADLICPMPYVDLQKTFDPTAPPGLLNYWKSSFLQELSADATDQMIAAYATAPSSLTSIVIEHLGGAVSRVGEGETAFSHRTRPYAATAASLWRDVTQSEPNITWTRRLWDAIRPSTSDAVYSNYLSDDEGELRVRAAYGSNYERLVAVKNRYDPTNVFRMNHNIKPTVEVTLG